MRVQKEISDALPKIITLSSTVLKTVMQKLLMECKYIGRLTQHSPPLLHTDVHTLTAYKDSHMYVRAQKSVACCTVSLCTAANSPLRPSELLVALHAIDCNEDDNLMKAVIKG